MKTGTKSILFGVHQFIWHPITVWLAWVDLFGFPTWRECLCILVHDVGYFGKGEMDGPDGHLHPELGAKIAGALLGDKYRKLCLCHSRSYADAIGEQPSKLCWADKWSPLFDPLHFYWLRGTLSGEIEQYRRTFPRAGGQSSLMWAFAFKDFVKANAAQIWAGAHLNDPSQYRHVNMDAPARVELTEQLELPAATKPA